MAEPEAVPLATRALTLLALAIALPAALPAASADCIAIVCDTSASGSIGEGSCAGSPSYYAEWQSRSVSADVPVLQPSVTVVERCDAGTFGPITSTGRSQELRIAAAGHSAGYVWGSETVTISGFSAGACYHAVYVDGVSASPPCLVGGPIGLLP